MAISLTNTDNISGPVALNGSFGLTTVTIGDDTFLYISGYQADTISIFRLNTDGTATFVDSVSETDLPAAYLDIVWSPYTYEANGMSYLVTVGDGDNGLSVFEINADGTLNNIQNIADDGTLFIGDVYGQMTSLTIGDTTYLYTPDYDSNGLNAFRVESDGQLTSIQSIADSGTLELYFPHTAHAVSTGGNHFVIVSGGIDSGVTVFSVAGDGTLTEAYSLDIADPSGDGTYLSTPTPIASVVAGGQTYIYVGGRTSDAISIYTLQSDGTLVFQDVVLDAGTLALDEIWDLSVSEIGGVSYMVVSGRYDNGITIFAVNEDGSLTEKASVYDADDPSYELSHTQSSTLVDLGGIPYVVASGTNDDGFSVFRIDLPISVSYNGSTVDTAETLAGAVSAAPAGGVVTLVDPSLYDGVAETVHVTQDNMTVDLGALYSVGARVIFDLDEFAYNIDIRGQSFADVLVRGSQANSENILTGNGWDRVYAGGGDDTVMGRNGNDFIGLGAGDDSADGGVGNDVINGWGGADTILGGKGFDVIDGGGTGDVLRGGDGGDSITGGLGWDKLYGDGGNDTLRGNEGNDRAFGGIGNDLIETGIGNDTLNGGGGNDVLIGGGNNDVIYGSDGNDTLRGANGNDKLYGGGWADTIDGGPGNDTVWGGNGPDTFVFDIGDGTLRVKDFADDVDQLDLDLVALGFASITQLVNTVGFTNASGHAVLDFGADGTIIVENTGHLDLINDII